MREPPGELAVVALAEDSELRVVVDGPCARLSIWWPAPYGQAAIGEAPLDSAALRRAIAALKEALHRVERATAGA
jgi:hypothetical protein